MDILNSWKEIANYLGRGVRTVQRWEFDLGLPVHRPKGKERSAVLAFPQELDAWLHGTPLRSAGNGSTSPSIGNGGFTSNGRNPSAPVARAENNLREVRESLLRAEQLRAELAESARRHQAIVTSLHDSVQRMVRGRNARSTAA